MKLLVLLPMIVVCAAVDRRDSPGLPPQDSIAEEAHHLYSNQTGHIMTRGEGDRHIRAKGPTCRAKDVCVIAGGVCVADEGQCVGRLVPGCRGRNCQCCIPDTLENMIRELQQKLENGLDYLFDANANLSMELESGINRIESSLDRIMEGCQEGFFEVAGSSQCYKYYGDSGRSYDAAKEKCISEGLVLAEPANPVNVRKYLVEFYGQAYTWWAARGNGTNLVWERSGRPISNTDPLWMVLGSSVTSDRCLLMLGKSHYDSEPNKPYFSDSCSNNGRYTLCEDINE